MGFTVLDESVWMGLNSLKYPRREPYLYRNHNVVIGHHTASRTLPEHAPLLRTRCARVRSKRRQARTWPMYCLQIMADTFEAPKPPTLNSRDFQNHVLHVSDNYWGGACRAATRWHAASLEALNDRRWADAAYGIGVLSHYFADPLMPLHTASSDQESVVHRPMEWSICKSYDEILALWNAHSNESVFQLSSDSNWVSDAVTEAAELSHPHYERLIQIYDLKNGAKDPPRGLNRESRKILASMFGYAITGIAAIIDRIAAEAESDLPNPIIAMQTVVAGLNMPSAWVLKKIESSDERRAVAAILDEFEKTGSVRLNAPPEVRSVQSRREFDGLPSTTPKIVVSPRVRVPHVTEKPTVPQEHASEPRETIHPARTSIRYRFRPMEIPSSSLANSRENKRDPSPRDRLTEQDESPQRSSQQQANQSSRNEPKRRSSVRTDARKVSKSSDIVDAPSIGPKNREAIL